MGIERECKLMGKKNYDIIVVGTGPTGIFTVLELLKKDGNLDILMLEKGKDISNRECPMKQNSGMGCINCDSCSVVSGWGGAGAYSDGKLSLSPKIGGHLEEYIGLDRLKKLISYTDQIYLDFGAPDRIFGGDNSKIDEIKTKAIKAQLKFIPAKLRHLGTGHTKTVLTNMKNYIESEDVEIKFQTNVTDFIIEDNKITGVKTAEGEIYKGENVIT